MLPRTPWLASGLMICALLATSVAPSGCGNPTASVTVFVPDDDPAMQHAIATARASMAKVDAAIDANRAQCLVKAAFRCPDGEHEVCWVLVDARRDGAYHGTLHVIPKNLPGLQAGSRVQVDAKDAVDWMIAVPGQPIEGNFTLHALLPRMSPEDAAVAKRQMGWK